MLIYYGCARRHRLNVPNCLVITNDINPKCYCNYTEDIRIPLTHAIQELYDNYDAFIFTPPCNYYSHANWRRDTSKIAQETKDLLPLCLDFCFKHLLPRNIPFIVENVQNSTFFKSLYPQYQFICGGHTYWSNVLTGSDFKPSDFVRQNKQYVCQNKRDGNFNVDFVLTKFLLIISE